MPSLAYDIKLECRTGTWRCSTRGWEPEYHIITWAREYSLDDAIRAIGVHLSNFIQVKAAWYEEVRLP
jgi:hypothetical protein